jgi:hypothetical protein
MSENLAGLLVVCPNCKKKDFVTTDKYDPNITPNGSMVQCTLGFHIDWLTSSTTGVSEMTCPECLAQLAPSGRLMVMLGEMKPTLNLTSKPKKEKKDNAGTVRSNKR